MTSASILLTNINNIIRDELFPLIGIPRETFGHRTNDIPNNLREIRDTLREMLEQSENQSQQLENIISKTSSINRDIKDGIPPETFENISKLFE